MPFSIFKKRELDQQVKAFIEYKREVVGPLAALQHREWLAKFCYITLAKNIYELTLDDIYYYKERLYELYAANYVIEAGVHSIRCLLRFYRRYDILAQMTKLGRKPNTEAIEKVRAYREMRPPMSYTKIIEAFRKEGKKIDRKQVHRWRYAKNG